MFSFYCFVHVADVATYVCMRALDVFLFFVPLPSPHPPAHCIHPDGTVAAATDIPIGYNGEMYEVRYLYPLSSAQSCAYTVTIIVHSHAVHTTAM